MFEDDSFAAAQRHFGGGRDWLGPVSVGWGDLVFPVLERERGSLDFWRLRLLGELLPGRFRRRGGRELLGWLEGSSRRSAGAFEGFMEGLPHGLSAEPDVLTDFLAAGGWRVVTAGSSGLPVGRPRKVVAVDVVRARIERELGRLGVSMGFDDLAAAAQRGAGRPSASDLAVREVLARVLDRVCYPPSAMPAGATSEALGCSLAAVYRFRREGAKLRNNSTKGMEGRYWGFRGWDVVVRDDPRRGFPPQVWYRPPRREAPPEPGNVAELPLREQAPPVLEELAA